MLRPQFWRLHGLFLWVQGSMCQAQDSVANWYLQPASQQQGPLLLRTWTLKQVSLKMSSASLHQPTPSWFYSRHNRSIYSTCSRQTLWGIQKPGLADFVVVPSRLQQTRFLCGWAIRHEGLCSISVCTEAASLKLVEMNSEDMTAEAEVVDHEIELDLGYITTESYDNILTPPFTPSRRGIYRAVWLVGGIHQLLSSAF